MEMEGVIGVENCAVHIHKRMNERIGFKEREIEKILDMSSYSDCVLNASGCRWRKCNRASSST